MTVAIQNTWLGAQHRIAQILWARFNAEKDTLYNVTTTTNPDTGAQLKVTGAGLDYLPPGLLLPDLEGLHYQFAPTQDQGRGALGRLTAYVGPASDVQTEDVWTMGLDGDTGSVGLLQFTVALVFQEMIHPTAPLHPVTGRDMARQEILQAQVLAYLGALQHTLYKYGHSHPTIADIQGRESIPLSGSINPALVFGEGADFQNFSGGVAYFSFVVDQNQKTPARLALT